MAIKHVIIVIIAVYNLPKDFFKKAQGAACLFFFPTNKYSECPMPCNEEEQQVHKFEKLEPTFFFLDEWLKGKFLYFRKGALLLTGQELDEKMDKTH